MYVNTTPKGETEGVLAFIIPVGQCCLALNGVHHDVGHQGQQQTVALAQERLSWPMMAEHMTLRCKAENVIGLVNGQLRS